MKEEKLRKRDYEDEYSREITEVSDIRGVFHSIGQWFNRNSTEIFDWFMRIIMAGLIFLALFGVSKCVRSDIERVKQQEIEWTTGDSTFVKKQDGYYIYRREIEGHKYYLYKEKNEYDQLVNVQYVPVNSCIDEP